ncbi:MAG: FeS cluster assembly scaffold protein NifU [Verrucomicrobiales bacterium]|nr:FeS cluster assembly scaffold protein NifU [Verrucomicrobiales bacterium]
MDTTFEQKVADALANPKNLGEMENADAVGTAGSAGCGDMVRLWLKFKEENGRKVIDRASFQSFGCETAIAVASLATEAIRGKTAEEVLKMKSTDLAPDLGPLPPVKLHCTQLVESALHAALEPSAKPAEPAKSAPTLLEQITTQPERKMKVVFLKDDQT